LDIFVLDIIVIDLFSAGGSPLKRQVNIAIINKSDIYGVILVLFLYYSHIDLAISWLFYHCLLNIFVLHAILYLEYFKWYQRYFLGKTGGVIVFPW
jgi:hypothetical protein